MRRILASIGVATLLGIGSAQAAQMSAQDRALLDSLSPSLQAEVKARATDGNTVQGVLETMLLNNIVKAMATRRIQMVDFDKGVAMVEGEDGKVTLVYFERATLLIRQ